MRIIKLHNIYRRPCKKCGEMYQPDGKFQKLCNNCKGTSLAKKIKKAKLKSKNLNNPKYKPMTMRCPYLSSSNHVCTHKTPDPKKTKYKRKCIYYKNIAKCPLLQRCESEMLVLDLENDKVDSDSVETPKTTKSEEVRDE